MSHLQLKQTMQKNYPDWSDNLKNGRYQVVY